LGTDTKPLTRAASLPLDPPPFYLEREVRLPGRGSWKRSTLVGLIVLLIFRLLLPDRYEDLPSLESLLAVSLGTVATFALVRFAAYWLVWLRVKGRFAANGGIHPAARGELPRNAFLLALITPIVIMIFGCLTVWQRTTGFETELVVAVAVIAAVSCRDLTALWRVRSFDRSHWIKVTKGGLDVLKPAVDFRHSRS
jgi:hypothetical protein